jgi:hypothetical protein
LRFGFGRIAMLGILPSGGQTIHPENPQRRFDAATSFFARMIRTRSGPIDNPREKPKNPEGRSIGPPCLATRGS